jgi:hypothetical protein
MRIRLRETGQLPQPNFGLWQPYYLSLPQVNEEPKSEHANDEYSTKKKPKLDVLHHSDPVTPLGEFSNPYSSAPDPTSSLDVTLNPAFDNLSAEDRLKAEKKAEMMRRRYGHSAALIYLALFLAPLSFIMWVLSVVHMIMGWQWPSGTHSRTLAYLQDERTWSNPALIANMPATCVAWLTQMEPNRLVNGGFFNADTETYVSNLLNTAIMTVATKYCAILHLGMAIPGAATSQTVKTDARINGVLRIYAYGVTGFMAIATIATAIYCGVERGQKKQDHFRYTNNATLTGGCSFGVVQAEKTWGYLDIAENLPLRLALAALGL